MNEPTEQEQPSLKVGVNKEENIGLAFSLALVAKVPVELTNVLVRSIPSRRTVASLMAIGASQFATD